MDSPEPEPEGTHSRAMGSSKVGSGAPLADLRSFSLDPRLKMLIAILAIGALAIQAYRVLISAYPVMISGGQAGSNYALDFGVYYDSAWRLIHNTGQLYNQGMVTPDWPLAVKGMDFKYLPFFSFFMLPFLLLNYTTALLTWNGFQLLLMPVMGWFIYRALKNFNIVLIVAVLWIALLQPFPIPPAYTISFYSLYHSQSYYWQWAEGQAKVLVTFLIVAAYYFSKSKKPMVAGLAYGLAFYDPRIPLYALPLILLVNWGQYKKFGLVALATLAAGDAILLFDGLGSSFLAMVLSNGISTPFYQYVWIPIYSIAALTTVEGVNFLYHAWLKGGFRVRAEKLGPESAGQTWKATK